MQVFLDDEEWKDYQKRVARLDAAKPQPFDQPIRFPNCDQALKGVLDEGTSDLCIRPDSELFEMLKRLNVTKKKLQFAFEMSEFVSSMYYVQTLEYKRRAGKEKIGKKQR